MNIPPHVTAPPTVKSKGISPKYKSLLNHESTNTSITEKNKINDLLEKEKQNNKWDSWNKIDKMTKINKLHQYADTYALQHKLSPQECISLKEYLVSCINQSKLQKSKEVFLDKEKMIIQDIPSLFFHPTHRHFTLRSQDAKRVSTLKSLTIGKGANMKIKSSTAPILASTEAVGTADTTATETSAVTNKDSSAATF